MIFFDDAFLCQRISGLPLLNRTRVFKNGRNPSLPGSSIVNLMFTSIEFNFASVEVTTENDEPIANTSSMYLL
ncbi:hypothetical protein Y032_0473g2113 [Ancylostoma ceylanicum]|uniref:Uncharacterized protein n=1 Tax=Ancylostoma ceylanicum TaxID=53326 RepID=A0A016WYK7_9BILA|nr:hypothetical protein Y032_0473g2113 [Ancylostoma ceylanicum]